MQKFAVIGAGNGGQVISAYLKLCGKTVSLYEAFDKVRQPLQQRGGVELAGVSLNGFAKLDLITGDLNAAVKDAECVFVVLPAFVHANIARSLAPCLSDGQTVIVCPGATCGALEFRAVFKEAGCKAKIRLAETNSLFYAARSYDGVAHILAVKNELSLAAIPSRDTDAIIADLKDVYPQLIPEKNVLATGMDNINTIVHPLPVLMNTGRIESGIRYKHYREGITPSIGRAIEAMDLERIAVGNALGLHLINLRDAYRRYYACEAKDICDLVRIPEAHATIMAPESLEARLITEDVPMGLVPLTEIARLVGVPTPIMDATITLASAALGRDLRATGRTLKSLGLEGMNKDQLLALVNG